MKTGIITCYFDRPSALRRYLGEVEQCNDENITWYIGTIERCCWDVTHQIAENEILRKKVKLSIVKKESLGAMRNRAVQQAYFNGCEYVIKQDIDCECHCYAEIIKALENVSIVNVGVKQGDTAYGNEYAVRTRDWIYCGGEPEWNGYGWEDYAFIARMMKKTWNVNWLKKTMRKATLNDCTHVFRDKIARKLNEEHDLFMIHHDHPRKIDGAKENRELFYNLIQELIK